MRRFVTVALLALAFLVASRGPILRAIGSYLVLTNDPVKADIALVLGGDGRGERIVRAAELVKAGFVPKVLVSGPDTNYDLHECDLAIPFAVRRGYAESMFLHFENTAKSTIDEANMAMDRLRDLGAHRVLLVTSNYHTRRAGKLFRNTAAARNQRLEFVVIAARDKYFSPDAWWLNREGQKTTFYEWLKTVAAWFNI
jgi:uncharacterized SAM-binding protein YcdF (DUF218 family)